MDAERLIVAGRGALARSTVALDIVAEAWQAQALARAIGHHLALCGPRELRSEARGLCDTGGREVTGPDHPALRGGGIRAAQLTGVADVRGALLGLGALLGEVGIALVGVACATDEEGLYWQCIEAIDAADESNDRVRMMLRRLTVRQRGRPPGAGRDGPCCDRLPSGGPLDHDGPADGRADRVGAELAEVTAPDLAGQAGLADPADSAAGTS
ncbi:DUF6099 family protein [Streptomyces sp. NRRL S-118]|uniref:DUF6099 family protein n=1 Tax=Streptomyces sp. NRRL S-118 TaxID=1463881 RepID=UPI000A6C1B15|nr:DUF6099 family protein [Streptomyces sp. NRRL S-118]